MLPIATVFRTCLRKSTPQNSMWLSHNPNANQGIAGALQEAEGLLT